MKAKILASTKNMPREEWLAMRRLGIGGSDAAAIVGANPYSSAIDVYADKLGLKEPVEENEAMRLGSILEPYCAKRFEEETGFRVQRKNAILQNPEHSFMLANVDRVLIGQNAGLEIKTTSMLNRTKFDNGEIPPQYYFQCLQYLSVVTDFDTWYIAVLVLGKGFHIFKVDRNEAEIAALIEVEKHFWEEHVMKQIPPPPDGSEAAGEVLKKLYPSNRGDGSLVPLYGKEAQIQKIITLESNIKDLEKESDALKQSLQMEIGEADGGVANGFSVLWRTQSRSSIDSNRLKKELPAIHSQYMRNSTFRRFEIKQGGNDYEGGNTND